MKKTILTFIIILSCNSVLFAQNLNEKILINFNDVSLTNAIKEIEKSTSYKFYLDPEWVDLNKKIITGSYSNITLEELLEKILTKTELNFIIIKKKVILTLNNKIHGEFPTNYFPDAPITDKADVIITNSENPVFNQQCDSLAPYSVKMKTSVVFIGKENKESIKKNFIVSGYIRNEESILLNSQIIQKVFSKYFFFKILIQ